jgi:hypothetical protein
MDLAAGQYKCVLDEGDDLFNMMRYEDDRGELIADFGLRISD